jgi:hypothetical protein
VNWVRSLVENSVSRKVERKVHWKGGKMEIRKVDPLALKMERKSGKKSERRLAD